VAAPRNVFGWSAPFQKERFLVVPGEAAREQLKLDDGWCGGRFDSRGRAGSSYWRGIAERAAALVRNMARTSS
jgi:hypothetical protein